MFRATLIGLSEPLLFMQNNEVFLPKGKQAHLCMVQRQKTRRITNYDRLRELAVNEGFGVFDIVFEELTPHQIVEFMRYCDGLVSVAGRSSVLLKTTHASAIASVLVLFIGFEAPSSWELGSAFGRPVGVLLQHACACFSEYCTAVPVLLLFQVQGLTLRLVP